MGASLKHAIERNKSLRDPAFGLFRTHLFRGVNEVPTAIPANAFQPDAIREQPFYFQTRVRIADNTAARSGLIMEYGSNVRCVAWWLTDQTIGCRGGQLDDNAAYAEYDHGIQWPAGLEMEIGFAGRTGPGMVGIYINGHFKIGEVAVNGEFDPSRKWANTNAGSFGQAVNGTVTPDVPVTTAPVNFSVIEPLQGFTKQYPRNFIAPVV